MVIPKFIKVFGFDWEIVFSKDVSHEGRVFGSTHFHSQKIFIDPDTPHQKVEQTVIHEIMHSIWWQTGLHIAFKQVDMEEQIISALSNGIYTVMKENGMLK